MSDPTFPDLPQSALPYSGPASETVTEPELVTYLDETVQEFAHLEGEWQRRQAQDVLHQWMGRLDLTAPERSGLESELQGLVTMLDKLERMVIHIAAFGMVGRGKSSLLNALLGKTVFTTGPTHGVTQTIQQAHWSVHHTPVEGSDRPLVQVTLPGLGQSHIELIDTPGIDEVAGEERETLALQVAHQADLILFVITGDLTAVEYQALSTLQATHKPLLLVLNKADQYSEGDRAAIWAKLQQERLAGLLSSDVMVEAAAAPRIRQALRQSDGTVTLKLEEAPPNVAALKLKILQVLDREGKSLVALNTMLFAAEVNAHVVQRKLQIRTQQADQLIWSAVMTKAIAVALNPVTLTDVLGGAAVDISMILALSRLYGMEMTQKGAIALLQKIALGVGGIGLSEVLTTLGLSSLKGLLGMAAPVTGGLSLVSYVSVALTQAGVAGVSAYGIGQVTKTYLANGATWGPEGPQAVIHRILASLDEESVLTRIKTELQDRFSQFRSAPGDSVT